MTVTYIEGQTAFLRTADLSTSGGDDGRFLDIDRTPADPADITFRATLDGTTTTIVKADMTRHAVGDYSWTIEDLPPGQWPWVLTATGGWVEQGYLYVEQQLI